MFIILVTNLLTFCSFTSAIRSGFVFQGNENITVGGGEELWLFLNRRLVLQVTNDPDSATIPCKSVNIADAVYGGESTAQEDHHQLSSFVHISRLFAGAGVVTPWEGVVVSGECVLSTELVDEQVELELDVSRIHTNNVKCTIVALLSCQIGERYHFTIFHVERGGCRSGLLIRTEGFDFILDAIEEPPRDYLVAIEEDEYVNNVIETIFLADTFSTGPPFLVRILRGAIPLKFFNETCMYMYM